MQTTLSQTAWQQALQHAVTDLNTLLRLLDIQPHEVQADPTFPLRVPRSFIDRMEKGNPHDPLLRQVLPTRQENQRTPGFCHDPLNEKTANKIPGLLHKYHGRALLILNPSCAVHCRYCFRQHFNYHDNTPGLKGWEAALSYIANDPSIEEVILSGGDPLMTKDALLTQFIQKLDDIPHLTTCRIHTRLPIVIPDRVTDTLVSTLANTRLSAMMVMHCNHPNEINPAVSAGFAKIRRHNISLLNQSVLLKHINDNATTLITLSKTLFQHGVLPYYLHQLDRSTGTAHFEVPENTARQLLTRLQHHLPGYLVPKLVKEIAGEASKTLLPPG
jgi:EF-P beta-lysylation protein EpmB